jgi:hypothetical protein
MRHRRKALRVDIVRQLLSATVDGRACSRHCGGLTCGCGLTVAFKDVIRGGRGFDAFGESGRKGRLTFFAVRESAPGPSRRSYPFAYGCFWSKQTKRYLGAPASGGVALYLTAAQQTYRPHDDRGGSKPKLTRMVRALGSQTR